MTYVHSRSPRCSAAVADAAAATAAALAAGSAALRIVNTQVDASAGGVAQETAIATVPAGSLVLGVRAEVDTAFDGNATTTLEVGISGNIDKYIDTVDFDPSAVAGTNAGSIGGTTNDQKVAEYLGAAEAIIATWTNDAAATAGAVDVQVIYIEFVDTDLADQIDAVLADVADLRTQFNALLAQLRSNKPSGILPT